VATTLSFSLRDLYTKGGKKPKREKELKFKQRGIKHQADTTKENREGTKLVFTKATVATERKKK
jgi:hypothetical protein